MSNNGANNEQWWMAGSKKNNTGGVRDSEKQDEHNGAYSNKGDQGQMMKSMTPGGIKVSTGNINKTGTIAGWTKVNGKRHVEGDNPSNTEDAMEHYSVKVGFIDVRFMCGNRKGFNGARGLKQFIAVARATDKYLWLVPLGVQDNDLCIPADVPDMKEGIQKSFRHRVSVKKFAGSIEIQTKF
jgi:hypothetical protein